MKKKVSKLTLNKVDKKVIAHSMAIDKVAKAESFTDECYVEKKVARSINELVNSVISDQRNIDSLKAASKKSNKLEAFSLIKGEISKAPKYMSDFESNVLFEKTINSINKISSRAKEIMKIKKSKKDLDDFEKAVDKKVNDIVNNSTESKDS